MPLLPLIIAFNLSLPANEQKGPEDKLVGITFKSERLFEATSKRVAEGSIVFSDDLQHFSYFSPTNEMFLDGKSLGKYERCAPLVFDATGTQWAFLSTTKDQPVARIKTQSGFKTTEFAPVRLFRAGTRGPLTWLERSNPGVRLARDGWASPFYPTVDKLKFSQDGSAYTLVYTSRVKPLTEEELKELKDSGRPIPEAVASIDYLVDTDKPAIKTPRIQGLYPYNNGKSRLEISLDMEPGEIRTNGMRFQFRAAKIDPPIFDPTDQHFALRFGFTKPVEGTNIDANIYMIDGIQYPTPPVQTGITFSPDGQRWVFCGYEQKQWFLIEKGKQKQPMDNNSDFPGCPNEGYKAAFFTPQGLGLLFQSRKVAPTIVIGATQLTQIPAEKVIPESLSVSPNGKWLAFVAEKEGKRMQGVMKIGPTSSALPTVQWLKPDEQSGLLRFEKAQWQSANAFLFVSLKGVNLNRHSVQISD